jgi:hypothetical protein
LNDVSIIPPNGLCYWRWGGRGFCLRAEKLKARKMLKKAEDPQRPVYAVLAGFDFLPFYILRVAVTPKPARYSITPNVRSNIKAKPASNKMP